METDEKNINQAYGFIYITTNLINGKKYLGQKSFSSNGKWRNYLGSGKALKRALKKYGKENFHRNIICFCNSLKELNQTEYELSIFLNVVEDNDWYNEVYGGGTVSGYHHSEETKNKVRMSVSGENSPMYGKTGKKPSFLWNW